MWTMIGHHLIRLLSVGSPFPGGGVSGVRTSRTHRVDTTTTKNMFCQPMSVDSPAISGADSIPSACMAAFELAANYAMEREQFGSPIASYQLVQEKLATMLSDVTQMQLLCTRMAQLQEQGEFTGSMAAMIKMVTSRKALAACREARDMFGGNGLLLENHIARHLTDMEVVSTYEGTDSIQALLVGREITGISAFTAKKK